MQNESTTKLLEQIQELDKEQNWIYRFNLQEGVVTPGPREKGAKNALKRQIINSLDLNGKRVLDLGCAEGMFSFYMAQAGAEVTALELNQRRLKKAELVKKCLGISNVDFHNFDLQSSTDWDSLSSHYDVGFCFSVLHRVSDPINLIANLTGRCGVIVFEWKAPKGFFSDRLSLAFHETTGSLDPRNIKQRSSLRSNLSIMDSGEEKPYWAMTPGAVKQILSEFGFSQFVTLKASRSSPLRELFAWVHLFVGLIFGHKDAPVAWRRYQRVLLVCSRNSSETVELIRGDWKHSWDGTED